MEGEHLAIVENGKIYLWSEPSNPAELSLIPDRNSLTVSYIQKLFTFNP